MKFQAEINVMPKKEILDPQGKAVSSSMKNLGLTTIQNVRIGKHISLEITADSVFPFKNKYTTPTTLGVDRMVLTSGAVLQYPNQNVLIIDAGTCVTYDFITNKNEYLGGAISPGLRLRYQALNDYTAKLPLLENNSPDNFIGNSTDESIHSGVINGLCFEIEGFISEFSVKKEQFTIILTGGDAIFLANRLKSTIFADENFLLKSLHQLYTYSLQND